MPIAETLADRVTGVFDRGRVDTVFGDVRTIDGVEVIPVARVGGGFGVGGGGGKAGAQSDDLAEGEGGGAGGGLSVRPVAVIFSQSGMPTVMPVVDMNARFRNAAIVICVAIIGATLLLWRRFGRR